MGNIFVTLIADGITPESEVLADLTTKMKENGLFPDNAASNGRIDEVTIIRDNNNMLQRVNVVADDNFSSNAADAVNANLGKSFVSGPAVAEPCALTITDLKASGPDGIAFDATGQLTGLVSTDNIFIRGRSGFVDGGGFVQPSGLQLGESRITNAAPVGVYTDGGTTVGLPETVLQFQLGYNAAGGDRTLTINSGDIVLTTAAGTSIPITLVNSQIITSPTDAFGFVEWIIDDAGAAYLAFTSALADQNGVTVASRRTRRDATVTFGRL